MKAIMISIKPKYVAKILNGEKTIEIRKTMPKCDLPIDVYIYCTKDNKHKLEYCDINEGCWSANDGGDYYNAKVVAKFTLNKVEMIRPIALGSFLKTSTLEHREIIDKSCLTENEIRRYLTNMYGYAWHIDNLEIFDKPKELSDFKHLVKGNKLDHSIDAINYVGGIPLTKAPQSWCYVEV